MCKLIITTVPAAVLAFTLCGCTGSEEPHGSTPPRLELVEELRIDGYEADLVPINSNAFVMRADGVIFVGQSMDYEVRAFNPDGSERFRIGGQGEGPGEFNRIIHLGLIGDTLWVKDGALNRFSSFSPEGSFVRSLPGPRQARPGLAAVDSVIYGDRIVAFYFLEPQAFVASAARPPGPQGQEYRDYLRVSKDGNVDAFLVRVGSETPTEYTIELPGGGVMTPGFPFANPSRFIADHHGNRWGAIAADLGHPEGPRLQLRMVDSFGRTLIERAYPFEPEPLPAAFKDSVIEAELKFNQSQLKPYETLTNRHALSAWERLARSRAPAVFPPLSTSRIGWDGTLWIGLKKTSGQTGYLVLDRAGNPLGTIEASRDIRVLDGDASVVWTVEEDRFGIPSLVRFRMRPIEASE